MNQRRSHNGWLHHLRSTFLNSLFPIRCNICGAFDTPLCLDCAQREAEPQIIPMGAPSSVEIKEQRSNKVQIQTLITAGHYANPVLREAMETYKFNGVRAYAPVLGTLLAKSIIPLIQEITEQGKKQYGASQPIVFVSVPLHLKRMKERGFDQNAMLAEICSTELARLFVTDAAQHVAITYMPSALVRTKNTVHQTTVSTEDRARNVQSAFSLTADVEKIAALARSHIILIDDIVTSGATFGACASILTELSPLSIHAAAVLRSQV